MPYGIASRCWKDSALPYVFSQVSNKVCVAHLRELNVHTGVSLQLLVIAGLPKIRNASRCVRGSEVLTCVCISEGVPLPAIEWPLLQKHSEFSVSTTVSHHTVNSSVTLTVRNHSDETVECISSNENGEAKENLTIQLDSLTTEGAHLHLKHLKTPAALNRFFNSGVQKHKLPLHLGYSKDCLSFASAQQLKKVFQEEFSDWISSFPF